MICWKCNKKQGIYVHKDAKHYVLCGTCYHKHNNKEIYLKQKV